MITKRVMNDLVALAHDAQSSALTLAEGIEEAADRGGVSKSVLRRVVMAYANDRVSKLEREALLISQMIGQQDLFNDLADGSVSIHPTDDQSDLAQAGF